jgi:oligopeptide transport system substrate-binding protein
MREYKMKKTQIIVSAAVMAMSMGMMQAHADAANKTINWTLTGDLKTTDPAKLVDTISQDTVINTGEGLYRVNAKGKAELAAAKSVKVSADGLKWTFTLRNNLKWSNGKSITAADFVYGWQRTNDPVTASGTAPIFYTGIKNDIAIQQGKAAVSSLGIKADGDHKLVVTLDHPMPQLKAELSFVGFFPQNKAFIEKTGSTYGSTAAKSISSGPYILKNWNGNDTAYTYVKNPYYWDAKDVKTKKIKIQMVTDATTGFNLYNSGKVDFTTLSPTQAQASKQNKAYKQTSLAATQYLVMNTENKLLANTDVRRAIQYAINRQQLTSKVLAGSGSPAKTYIPAGLVKDPNSGEDFAKAAATGVVKYDKKNAAAYWEKGVKAVGDASKNIVIMTDDTDTQKQAATYIQAQLEANLKGLKVTIKSVANKPQLAALQSHNFDIAIQTWNADYSDPIEMMNLLTTGSSYNYGKWSDSDYDKYVTAASTTDANNAKTRFKDLIKAEQIIEKKVGVVPLNYSSVASFWRPSVKDVQLNQVGNTFDFKYAVKH